MKEKVEAASYLQLGIIWSVFIKIGYTVFMSIAFKYEELQEIFCGGCGSKVFVALIWCTIHLALLKR